MQPRRRPPGTSVAVSMEGRELSDPDGFLPLPSSASVFLPVFFHTGRFSDCTQDTLCMHARYAHNHTHTQAHFPTLLYLRSGFSFEMESRSLAHSLRSLVFALYHALLSFVFTQSNFVLFYLYCIYSYS